MYSERVHTTTSYGSLQRHPPPSPTLHLIFEIRCFAFHFHVCFSAVNETKCVKRSDQHQLDEINVSEAAVSSARLVLLLSS